MLLTIPAKQTVDIEIDANTYLRKLTDNLLLAEMEQHDIFFHKDSVIDYVSYDPKTKQLFIDLLLISDFSKYIKVYQKTLDQIEFEKIVLPPSCLEIWQSMLVFNRSIYQQQQGA
jgi:hypothetical protein